MANELRIKSYQLRLCNVLYEGGYKFDGKMYKPEMFSNMKEMLNTRLIYDAEIYSYLTAKGLLHPAFCLLCGDDLDENKGKFDLFGRYYYMCDSCFTQYAFDKDDKKNEGCYIVTSCYGDYNHPDVLVLRQFRDETLSKTYLGSLFVRIYYLVSPEIAKQVKNVPQFNKLLRDYVIRPIVRYLRNRKSDRLHF